MKLPEWLSRNFGAVNTTGNEIQLHCPKCGDDVFYFNLEKKVGYCHKAKCGFKPTLKELGRMIGNTPLTDFERAYPTVFPRTKKAPDILLPPNARPIGEFTEATLEVEGRGVDPVAQEIFDLRFDGFRIYIPVFYDGKLVQYVGRAAWWIPVDIPRYKYAKGVPVTKYLYNWDMARNWETLTLVENTFVSLWLREHNVTTNFGSNLSESQANLIARSRAKSVAILWDEGAVAKAEKAAGLLKSKGVAAAYCKMIGQPDDHSSDRIKRSINDTHERAIHGELWTNMAMI